MNKNKQFQNKCSPWKKILPALLGLFLTLAILEIALRIGGFIMLSLQERRNLQSIRQKGALRIMCLGESTTQDQYPAFLEEVLNRSNIGIKFSVIDKGLVGINTDTILLHLKENINKYQPDLVVTMMGNNDSQITYYRDIPEANTGIFRYCRLYRFGRLLYMNILNKIEKKGIYGLHKRDSVKNGLKEAASAAKDRDSPGIGQVYLELGDFPEAEHSFKQAIQLNPKNERAYCGLGLIYRNQGRFAEAEALYRQALEINPDNDESYRRLGRLCLKQGKIAEAETAYRQALEINPYHDETYRGLGWVYRAQGKFAEAEEAFRQAMQLNPKNERTYAGMATLYSEIGNNELLREYWEKAERLRQENYNPVTINNYLKLKQILDSRKIRLVCVQYPVRSIEPLKKIFEGNTGIIFVDNEKIFKDFIINEGYKEYFQDTFGGDFGHCTEKGNRLLAENIAKAILKEVFNK